MTITLNGTSGIVNDATDLNYTGTLTGGTGIVNLGSGQFYKAASGNIGLGTTSPTFDLHVYDSTGTAQFVAQGNAQAQVVARAAGGQPQILGQRSTGTAAAPTIVTNGTRCVRFYGEGYDGVTYQTAGAIDIEVDGVPGASDMPGRMIFSTTADGAAAATERMRIDSSGYVGINNSSPTALVSLIGPINDTIVSDRFSATANDATIFAFRRARGTASSPLTTADGDTLGNISFRGYDGAAYQTAGSIRGEVDNTVSSGVVSGRLVFMTANGGTNSEAARIDRAGNFMVNTTDSGANVSSNPTKDQFCFNASAGLRISTTSSNIINRSGDGAVLNFRRNGSAVGSISVTASATAYNTSSDYRLKDITGPLTGSGEFIDALQPKVGTWKADGSKFVGFIAHEVQEVSPSSVVGTKDEVDADGNPVMQGVAYGSAELIANMVAELQALRKRVAELEAK